MRTFPSLVQQPGLIPGVAGVLPALSTVSPHAHADELRLVVPTTYPKCATRLLVHAGEDPTTLIVDSVILENRRSEFTDSSSRRAAGRR